MTPTTSTAPHPAAPRLTALALIAACATWAAAPASAAPDSPPYAGMLEAAATWRYEIERELTWGVHDKPSPDVQEHGTATCRVEQVRRLGAATVASITCELPPGASSTLRALHELQGDWVATARGLWHSHEPILTLAAIRKLTRGPAIMPSHPRVGHEPPLKSAPASYAYQTRRDDRWCTVSVDVEASVAGTSTTCFEGGTIASIISGGESYGEGGAISKGTITRLH